MLGSQRKAGVCSKSSVVGASGLLGAAGESLEDLGPGPELCSAPGEVLKEETKSWTAGRQRHLWQHDCGSALAPSTFMCPTRCLLKHM